MDPWTAFGLGVFLGVFIGFFLCGLAVMAKENEKEIDTHV